MLWFSLTYAFHIVFSCKPKLAGGFARTVKNARLKKTPVYPERRYKFTQTWVKLRARPHLSNVPQRISQMQQGFAGLDGVADRFTAQTDPSCCRVSRAHLRKLLRLRLILAVFLITRIKADSADSQFMK
jgi:hypothetical protein